MILFELYQGGLCASHSLGALQLSQFIRVMWTSYYGTVDMDGLQADLISLYCLWKGLLNRKKSWHHYKNTKNYRAKSRFPRNSRVSNDWGRLYTSTTVYTAHYVCINTQNKPKKATKLAYSIMAVDVIVLANPQCGQITRKKLIVIAVLLQKGRFGDTVTQIEPT